LRSTSSTSSASDRDLITANIIVYTDPKKMDLIKLHQIKLFALEQMEKWGVSDWNFVWDNKAVQRYGQCRYGSKEIGISKKLASINSLEETKDTVLHEIAHALTGPGHGHDRLWKQKCVLVGARPERCYTPEDSGGTVKTIKGKWKLINKETGQVYRYYHRRPRRQNWDCISLRGRKKETYGKLQVVRS